MTSRSDQHNPGKRAEELRAELDRHNHLYYVLAQPEIGDREYDALYKELEAIEAAHPELLTPESPTQRVGGAALTAFNTVQHAAPMMSLNNTYARDELRDFDKRVRRLAGDLPLSYVLEPKIDGVAVSLRYEAGRLVLAATRGDGVEGDDITANVRTIRNIPLRLRADTPPPLLELRGEIYMTNAAFARLNTRQREAGAPPFANPRNATAGSLKQLDPRIVARRPLSAVLYATGATEGIDLATHRDLLECLEALGLPTVPRYWHCPDIDAALAALDELDPLRSELGIPVDGGVIKVNERSLYHTLGVTAKSPRWAVAYKYEPERAETVLRDITVQVGRTGVLTPVAELDATTVAGSTVRRATLHNQDEIRRKDIRIGDHVIIEKAGEVIPAVLRVLKEKRSGDEATFDMPTACPACGGAITQREGEVARRCENLQCPVQGVRLLNHFASRAALDIEALGGIVAEKLVARKVLDTPLDLFGLDKRALAALNLGTAAEPRVLGEKNATKLLEAVERARRLPLSRWLYALGIPNVGKTIARQNAAAHDSLFDVSDSPRLQAVLELDRLTEDARRANPKSRTHPLEATVERRQAEADLRDARKAGTSDDELRALRERIAEIKARETVECEKRAAEYDRLTARCEALRAELADAGLTGEVGPVVARSVLDFFASPRGRKLVERLRELDIEPRSDADDGATSGADLTGMTFVLTGTLEHMTRDEAAECIEQRGGKVTSSVSGNTTYLVAGANTGARKTSKADELGVTVLDEAGLMDLLGTSTSAKDAPPAAPPGPHQTELGF